MFPQQTKTSLASNCNCSTTAIVFLQRKQVEILAELHQEIARLQRENSDLKFLLYTKTDVTPQIEKPKKKERRNLKSHERRTNSDDKLKVSKLMKELEEAHSQVHFLESTLTSMDKMLENSNFLQVQAEKQSQIRDMEIQMLQKELHALRNSDPKTVLSLPKKKCHTSRLSYEDEQKMMKETESRRSLSSSHHFHRRRSLSILPTNYKESVATLPPIGSLQSETDDLSHHNKRGTTVKRSSLPGNFTNLSSSSNQLAVLVGNLGRKKALS